MTENIKIYTSDEYWQHIFTDLGAVVVATPNVADIDFDDDIVSAPISINDLKSTIFNRLDNQDIIKNIFGKYVILPILQHKIIITLYKNPDISIHRLKELLGFLPDVATHTVENAIYQLRKNYGHDFIQNAKGKYKIGHL